MESSHGTLRLYAPLSKMSCVSRFLSHRTATGPPFRASRNLPPEPPLEEDEEGTTESERPSFHLSDFREVLQVLDDFCEIRRLTELLRLHVHRQAVVEMENQQGAEVKPCCPGLSFNRDSFQESGFQVPQKRRAEGRASTSNRVAARFPLVPSKTSSPQVICPSVSRRTIRDPPELHPARTRFPFKKDLSTRNGFTIILKSSPPDSDTDLSEYDNEKYASSGDLEKLRITNDEGRRTPADKKIQPGGDGDQAKTEGEKHGSPWTDEKMGNKTAVMGKMEELEGIVHQVRLSSGWMDEGGHGRDGAHFVSDGDAQLFNVERGNMGSSDDQHHLIEEFQALGEALSQSLHQVLKMEAAKAERESSIKTQRITLKPNHSRSTKRPLADSHESVFPLLSPLLNNLDRDSSSSHHDGHHKHVPTVLEHGGERVFQENLELSEQDQTSGRTSEIGDLLCSGKTADPLFIHSSCHHTFGKILFQENLLH